MKAIIGRKVGMTQVFAQDGTLIPVTVIEVAPNVVLQKKTKEIDGYDALQVGIEEKRANLVNKPLAGHFKKANTTTKRYIKEVQGDELSKFNVGESLTVDLFKAGEIVDVIGLTKGHGFQGVIKRWGAQRGPSAHGSGYHRGVGTLATSGRTNNRVHPGKKMPGHMGNNGKTILNLTLVAIDTEKNALLVKGGIPGANRSIVTVRSAVKTQKNTPAAKTLVNYSSSAK